MGSQIRPLPPGAPRSTAVCVPWKAVPHPPGHLPPVGPLGGASCWLLSGPWASWSLDLREKSMAHPIQKVNRETIAPQCPGPAGPTLPWPKPLSLLSALQATIQTQIASCHWMSKAAPMPPRTRQTARMIGWRLRTNGTRRGAPSTAPRKVSQCWAMACLRACLPGWEQRRRGGARGGRGRGWAGPQVGGAGWGEGPVHSICGAEAGRPWRVSLGTLTSRTPRSWSRSLLGTPVLRLQDVEVERGDCSLGPHCQEPQRPQLEGGTLSGLQLWECGSGPRRRQGPHGGTLGNILGVAAPKVGSLPAVDGRSVPQWIPWPTTSRPAGPTTAWLAATVRSPATSRA